MKAFTVLLFIAIALQAHSQAWDINSDTIKWSSNAFIQNSDQQQFNLESWFISYEGNKIDWVQNEGEVVYTFDVSSVEGSFTSGGGDEEIIFHVSRQNKTGVIRIVRESGAIRIIPELVSDSKQLLPFQFIVTQTGKIQ